jgi:hypothetical protein
MPPILTTRSRFDVRVGSIHTLEVLLQIRSSDLTWWNSNLRDHERQLYKLIGRRILPAELKDEIQSDLDRELRFKNVNGGEISTKKGVVVGEVNLKKMADNKTKAGKKRGKQATKDTSKTKKAKSVATETSKTSAAKDIIDTKRPKLLRETGKWVMGESIQACYIMEEIDRTASCSMAFRPMKKSGGQESKDCQPTPAKGTGSTVDTEEKLIPLATFRSWNKLSKRLNIWVFKFDPNDPTDLSVSEDAGFPRPELLPLSDIFRQEV